MSEVRVRLAPSPTGLFHVGTARTALYNWLYARQTAGKFLLRIEDTDAERNKPEWIEGIQSALRWLDLEWDDEIVFQSDLVDRHTAAAEKLFAQGDAYYCDCTQDDVKERTRANAIPGYDNHCRNRGLEPAPGRALRFKVPEGGSTTVRDVIRGNPVFDHSNIEDFVIVRSTGVPLFALANAVDDCDMRITHVMRGEEHLPNTPKIVLMWERLTDLPPPTYVHLPLLVNEKRQKLSKRRDKVGLEQFIEEGYLPDAMNNYLALLGWSPGDEELVKKEDMLDRFRLEDISNSPAYFDLQKLSHFNAEYIRALPVNEFLAKAAPFLERGPWKSEDYDPEAFAPLAPLVQERVRTLSEVPGMIGFLFAEPEIGQADWDKVIVRNENAKPLLDAALGAYANTEWNSAALHEVTLAFGEARGVKLGKAQAPIRLVVTGKTVGPPLFESLEVLGRARVLDRLTQAIEKLDS